MKKVIFYICIVFCFCSCNKKLSPQNPEIKLSEEHGKMLNLIINFDHNYSNWCIDYDVSCDNYIYEIYYTDFDNKIIQSCLITHLQYCNGIITDVSNYNYYDGVTHKRVYYDSHIRWTDSYITVQSFHGKCKYPLNNPNSLKPSTKNKYAIPAIEITKVDDNKYRYIREEDEVMEDEYTTWCAGIGVNYIEFDTLDTDDTVYDVLRIWNEDESLCCKLYFNGGLKMKNMYSHDGKIFNTEQYTLNKNLTEGNYYSYSEGSTIFKYDPKEELYPVVRKYDDSGRLVYEEDMINDKEVTVKLVSKKPLDIKEICSNFENPINFDTKIVDK